MNDFDPIKISSFFSKTSDTYWASLIYTHVENYIEKPNKGRLFGAIELKCDNYFDCSKNGDILKRFVQNDYYSNNAENILESYEVSLHNLKHELTKLVERNKSSLDGKIDINCLLVTIKDNVAYFGMIGELDLELYRGTNYTELNKFFKDTFANGIKVFSVVLSPSDVILIKTENSQKKILNIKFDSCLKNMNFENLSQTPLAKDVGIGVFALEFGHKNKAKPQVNNLFTNDIKAKQDTYSNGNFEPKVTSKFDLYAESQLKNNKNDLEENILAKNKVIENLEETERNLPKKYDIFGDSEPISISKNTLNNFAKNEQTFSNNLEKSNYSTKNEISPELAKEVFDINYKKPQNKFLPKLQSKFEKPKINTQSNTQFEKNFENDLSVIQKPITSVDSNISFDKFRNNLKNLTLNLKTKIAKLNISEKFQNIKDKFANLSKKNENFEKSENHLSYKKIDSKLNNSRIVSEHNKAEINQNFFLKLRSKLTLSSFKLNIGRIIVVVLLLVIIGIISSMIIKNNNEIKAQNDLYANLNQNLKLATDLQKNADNQVLINPTKAQDLLTQATKKLADIISQNTLKDANLRNQVSTKVTELKTQIAQVIDKIQKNTYINDSYVLQELALNFQGIQIVGMEVSGNNIFVADQRGNLYKSSITNIGFTQILQTPIPQISSISQDLNGKILLFSSTDGLYRLNDDNSVKKYDNLNITNVGIAKSMTSFKVGELEYLYFLVPQTGELKRARKSGDNYLNVELRKQDDLFKFATDIKIDGKVWILTTNGIKRYYNNADDELNLSSEIPQNLTSFQAFEIDANNAYFSDNTNNRIVILAKQNGTDTKTMQYLYNIKYNGKYKNFENILDLKLVGSDIYILDSKRLYKVAYSVPQY